MSRQTTAALAAIVGLIIGLGVFAGVVLWLRGDETTAGTGTSFTVDTGATEAIDTGIVELPDEGQTSAIDVGGFPNAVAVGEGSAWVVRDGRRVTRIDAATGKVTGRIGAGDELGSERPCGIDVAAGRVWATTLSGNVSRIATERGRSSRLIPVEDAACVAANARGVWVTSPNLGLVTRLDPETGETLAEIELDGFPQGIVVGFGSVWVATSDPPDGADGAVSRIDPRSNEVVRTILVPNLPEFLAAGAGAVWVSSNNGTVVEIDPGTNQLVATIRISEGGRTSIAAGLDSVYAVALALPGETAPVYRIDPASALVDERTIAAGRNPLGLAVGAGSLWITNYGDGTVTRYTP